MEKLQITTALDVYASVDDLPSDARDLMSLAVEARKKAYAPYSQFKVGAALLLDNGEVVVGSNQENAAYPSGLCAERVAIFHAGSKFPDAKILLGAVTAASSNKMVKEPVPSCGACRQSMLEYEHRQKSPISLYFMGEEGKVYRSHSVKDLLPFTFNASFL